MSRTRRDLCVIQRPTGELAISSPSMSGHNRRRHDMIVIERSYGGLKIVKRRRPKVDPTRKHEQQVVAAANRLSAALEEHKNRSTITVTHTSTTGELPRWYYMLKLLNR